MQPVMEMKTCSKCKIEKDIDQFYKNKKGKNGIRANCKECDVKQVTEIARRKKLGLPSIRQEKEKIHGELNSPDYQHSSNLKYNFGIVIKDYSKIFEEQGGCCAICGKHQSEFKKKLFVDHDHKTNKVRGLLCFKCNYGIGYLKDDIGILNSAIDYLKKYNCINY